MSRRATAQLSIFDRLPAAALSPVVEVPVPNYLRGDEKREHTDAIRNPAAGYERALISIFRGLAEYAEAHRRQFDSNVGDDYYSSECIEQIGHGLHGLLSCECGRIDPGSFSSAINALIESGGTDEAVEQAAVMLGAESKSAPEAKPTEEIGKRRITDRQRELLANVRVEDNFAVYVPQGRIDDWDNLKSTMLALGGTWRKKTKSRPGGFEFSDDVDAAEMVRFALETGGVFDPKAAEFFETNQALSDELAAFIDPQPGDLILEPSAGKGALALAIRRRCPGAIVHCIEPFPENRTALEALGLDIIGHDFVVASGTVLEPTYDHVIANPPFSSRQDVHHIRLMLRWLKPGGRLAAIASAGVKYRDDNLGRDFRAELARHGAEIIDNPPGSFAHAGTLVNTVRILAVKRG